MSTVPELLLELAKVRDELTTTSICLIVTKRQRDRLQTKLGFAEQQIGVLDQLLVERNRILEACPCPVHGPSCVPHVLEILAGRRGHPW